MFSTLSLYHTIFISIGIIPLRLCVVATEIQEHYGFSQILDENHKVSRIAESVK